MKQIRIYTIATREAAEVYVRVHWERHKRSLLKYGIRTDAVYTEMDTDGKTRVAALVSCEGDDMRAQDEKYMQSEEFREDMKGFDLSAILGVENIYLQ